MVSHFPQGSAALLLPPLLQERCETRAWPNGMSWVGSGMDLLEIVSLTGVLLQLSLERAISGVSVTLEVRMVTELPPGKNLMRTAPLCPKLPHLQLPGTKSINPLCAKASFRSSRVYDSADDPLCKETGTPGFPFLYLHPPLKASLLCQAWLPGWREESQASPLHASHAQLRQMVLVQ